MFLKKLCFYGLHICISVDTEQEATGSQSGFGRYKKWLFLSLSPLTSNRVNNLRRSGTCQVGTSPGRLMNFAQLILASLCQ